MTVSPERANASAHLAEVKSTDARNDKYDWGRPLGNLTRTNLGSLVAADELNAAQSVTFID